ncbi:hypothetical protein L7F22_062144 [Adiantum nelumboides]|nr:hypothetical protein [Adiantum nelumboides]
MDYQNVELAILCADNLKDVRHLARMQTYAKVWVDPNVKYMTNLNELNGVNPVWKDKFVLRIPTRPLDTDCLNIEIYTSSFTGNRLVGRVHISLLDILQPNENGNIKKQGNTYYANYSIRDQGKLYISFCLMDKVKGAPEALPNPRPKSLHVAFQS